LLGKATHNIGTPPLQGGRRANGRIRSKKRNRGEGGSVHNGKRIPKTPAKGKTRGRKGTLRSETCALRTQCQTLQGGGGTKQALFPRKEGNNPTERQTFQRRAKKGFRVRQDIPRFWYTREGNNCLHARKKRHRGKNLG